MGVSFAGSSLAGELASPVEASPEAPSMGVISTGAGLAGVASGGMTCSKSLSAEQVGGGESASVTLVVGRGDGGLESATSTPQPYFHRR